MITPVTSSESHFNFRPRLTCRLVRQWCVISDRQPAHVRSCPSCQTYFRADDVLERDLRRNAITSRREGLTSSPDLEHAILRAVRDSAPTPSPALRPTSRARTISAILGIAAAGLALTLSLRFEPTPQRQTRVASPAPTDDAAVILTTMEALSSGLVDAVIPAAGEFVAENPLQQELGLVYSDLRSALDFLTLNFLPATGMKPAPPGQRRS